MQNSPTLSVVNDDTTSGPLPLRMPCSSLSSVTFGVDTTVMLGCSFSKALMFAWIAATSWGWLQPCQNLMVTGSLAFADD